MAALQTGPQMQHGQELFPLQESVCPCLRRPASHLISADRTEPRLTFLWLCLQAWSLEMTALVRWKTSRAPTNNGLLREDKRFHFSMLTTGHRHSVICKSAPAALNE